MFWRIRSGSWGYNMKRYYRERGTLGKAKTKSSRVDRLIELIQPAFRFEEIHTFYASIKTENYGTFYKRIVMLIRTSTGQCVTFGVECDISDIVRGRDLSHGSFMVGYSCDLCLRNEMWTWTVETIDSERLMNEVTHECIRNS